MPQAEAYENHILTESGDISGCKFDTECSKLLANTRMNTTRFSRHAK
jgi:hypothetical protein